MLGAALLIAAALLAGIGLLIYLPARAATPEKPNIVIVMSDDQDMDSLPVMRKLMANPEGSWVNFTHAFSNTSICTPARATLLTGQYSHTNGILGNNWGADFNNDNTLAVWLDDAGYKTALIGKFLHYQPGENGDERKQYDMPGWDLYSISYLTVDEHTQEAVDFISDAKSPFFLWLAYRAPHKTADPPPRYEDIDVYVPPDRPNFNEKDMSGKPEYMRKQPLLTPEEIIGLRKERANSQRELLAVDDGIESVVNALKAKGELDNTMIIFVGDNGFSWGSHRLYEKLCPYEECSMVPLFIRYPGTGENRIEEHFVSMVDLAATIADYAGVKPKLPQDGRSFLPLLNGTAPWWDDTVLLEKVAGRNAHYAARSPGWTYVEYITGEKELYDLTADPYQLKNLAGKPGYAVQQAVMAQKLYYLLNPPAPTPTATPTVSPTPTGTPTATGTPSPTSTPSLTPTDGPSPTPTATETPSPTATDGPSPTPTATETATPTETPSPTATDGPSPTPSPTATAAPPDRAIYLPIITGGAAIPVP